MDHQVFSSQFQIDICRLHEYTTPLIYSLRLLSSDPFIVISVIPSHGEQQTESNRQTKTNTNSMDQQAPKQRNIPPNNNSSNQPNDTTNIPPSPSTPTIPIVTPIEIYRSEVINKNLNPEWKTFSVVLGDIWEMSGSNTSNDNSNSNDALLEIACYDHDAVGKSDLIGKFEV